LSHRLVYIARRRRALADALYAAYFEFAATLATSTCVDVARRGLDAAETQQLAGDAGTAEVLADEFARQVGISGVPFFIFNDRLVPRRATADDTGLRQAAVLGIACHFLPPSLAAISGQGARA
jgi:predicted DsbA family dithiol-disulfide isomerase